MEKENIKIYEIDKDKRKKLKNKIKKAGVADELYPLPKYAAQIFNIISNTGQATRPKVVGQMSEIIPNFINNFYDEKGVYPDYKDWEQFYLREYVSNYEDGFSKLKEYVSKYEHAMKQILNNEELAKVWYNKFIFYQNFEGFEFEKIVFEFIKENYGFGKKPFIIRNSTKKEESKNIDFVVANSTNDRKLLFNSKPSTYSIEAKFTNISNEIIIVRYIKDKISDNVLITIEKDDEEKIIEYINSISK